MECSCTVETDSYEGGPSFHKVKIQTAMKKHRCSECGRAIVPGEDYEYVFGIWDHQPDTNKTCLDCKSIRDTFFNSWIYTQIWDNFQDEFGYHGAVIPESCISELTPGARARVCEFIENGGE